MAKQSGGFVEWRMLLTSDQGFFDAGIEYLPQTKPVLISGECASGLSEQCKSRPRYQYLADYMQPTRKPRFDEAFSVGGVQRPGQKVVLLCVKTVKRDETLAKRFSETVRLATRNIKAAHPG